MALPTLKVEMTTDDPDDTTPTWTDVSSDVRAFSTNRGRDNELARVEAGTATVTLNNRSRSYDPTDDATLRPMNRWRISAVMDGPVTEEIFLGYAESYEQQWPAVGRDAVTVVSLVDEFKVLALDKLPATDPPRDTYADVVLFDEPAGYWRAQGQNDLAPSGMEPVVGSVRLSQGSAGRTETPIVGDWPVDEVGGNFYGARSTTSRWYSMDTTTGLPELDANAPGDAGGLSAMTFETWFKSSEATPGAIRQIATGPFYPGGAFVQWSLQHLTNGKVRINAANSTPTNFTADSAATLSANTWYHLALVVTGSNTLLYINGVQDASASFSGTFGAKDTGTFVQIGTTTAVGGTRYYDELAFYRYALGADRVLAHYTAGVDRGYPIQSTEDRAVAVVADSESVASTNLNGTTGTQMIPAFMAGRSPLDHLRDVENAEQGVLFIARDGTITLLEVSYQGISPWNAVAATFDDDGTDLPYQDIQVDYSDSFLYNEINITRTGGTTQTRSDATSISAYFKRSLNITDLPIVLDGDADGIAQVLLARYKDPVTRVTQLSLLATEEVAEAVFPLDIGYQIRVFRTQPTGGRIDQSLWIQRIAVDGEPGKPWRITLGVSPF